MWYFADGDQALIRIHSDAAMGSQEFFDAPAERSQRAAAGAHATTALRPQRSIPATTRR